MKSMTVPGLRSKSVAVSRAGQSRPDIKLGEAPLLPSIEATTSVAVS